MAGSEKAPSSSDKSRRKVRFSIGQLLVLTAIVSVVLMVLVTLLPPLWSLAVTSRSTKTFFDTLWEPLARSGLSQEYGRRVPMYLVCAVAAVLLGRRWKKHPRVSVCALAGLTGLLLLELVGFGVALSTYYRMQAQLSSVTSSPQTAMPATPIPVPPMSPLSPMASEMLLTYHRYIRPATLVCCWVLIFTAILGWREQPKDKDSANSID
jgi:hypothetical protein